MDISKKNSAEFWDSLAKPCSHYERRSAYADEFIKRSGILPGESVLDMGCGSGTLSLPLSDDGHHVVCCDFSVKMLQSVRDTVAEESIKNIDVIWAAWQDDWDEKKIPVCDLAFASRCMFDADPFDAVKKISSRARRRVCITLPLDANMFKSPQAAYQIGSAGDRTEYMLDVLKAAFALGFRPSVNYMVGKDGRASGWAFISWDK